MTQYDAALQHLLTVYNLLAPTGKEQTAMVALVAEMQRERLTDKQIVRHVAGAIVDGVAYGNWPK